MRAENRTFGERWTLFEGVEAYYARYDDNTFQRLYRNGDQIQTNQNTKLGIFGWGAFASAQYKTPDDRLTATVGLRLDGCNYSSKMARFWENLSPTVSLSYRVLPQLAINAAAGFYHQLPPYTALGYTDASVGLANK